MKILLVSHFFPPNRVAGAERRALGYAQELQKLGHNVQVVCAGDWDQGKQHWNGFVDEVYQGVPVRRLNFNWSKARDPNHSLYDNPLVEEFLGKWLDEWQPDVVHVLSLLTLTAGVMRAVKARGLPLVFTLVDFWMICPRISLVRDGGVLCDGHTSQWDCLRCMLWHSRTYHRLRRVLPEAPTAAFLSWASRHRWVSRQRGLSGMALDMGDRRRVMAEIAPLADCVTAPSTNLARVMDESGLFPHPVRVIHSGHDLDWLKDMPPRQPAVQVRLGFIGQLIRVKGAQLLIRAFQAARVDGKAQLLIYGDATSDPQYAASLRQLAQGDRNIHFMSAFPANRLGEVFAGLDVLVVPSQWHENNPRVIQEAFASRTPVIASNVGGIAEFIQHDVNGLLFQYDRVEDLGVQIRRVVDEPETIRRLQKGIGPVKTIAEEMQEYLTIYQGLIDSCHERAPKDFKENV